MIIKRFTEENIDFVFDNLWQQGKDELRDFETTQETTRKAFKDMIQEPWALSFYQEEDGPCCALSYLKPIGNMAWQSAFAATEEGFKSIWFSLTKYLRGTTDLIVNDLTEGKGRIELLTTSDSDLNWFSALGFTLTKTDGAIDYYLKKAV